MTAPVIRIARAQDAPALSELMRRLFLQAYAHSADPANVARLLDTNFGADVQRAELEDPGMTTLLVEERGALQGYAQLRYRAQPPVPLDAVEPAQLSRIYLDLSLHGRGTAPALVHDVAARAGASGADALWLCVWKQAPRAIRFYEKCGFAAAGTTVFMVGEHATDDWVMSRRLAPGRAR